MARYAALLRGINVTGNSRVAMADLRAWLADLGYTGVRTHLNSGNAVFTAPEEPAERIAAAIEGRLTARLGREVPVIVRTAAELAVVVAGNPLEIRDPARCAVAFLAEDPAPERLSALKPAEFAPEEVELGEKVLYLYFPNGQGRSTLGPTLERRLGVPMTVRNWNTVTRLLALTDA
ncbi:DUF1697 domain-containing protein [Actinoallomurus rhizosphaericola]|uniref:DUF1697 domain-containing protein n=1 Tax=Actinoallomurus rhizosphaericola TaxID=2952536 RepID=UPI002090266E|nr:DUF1697 domain-containing protein [Actinoallomurus rhizosphaericola]MCO5994739.1 DUF1697 domain-containing protein [Actinoallomurus rhizosphaericola]